MERDREKLSELVGERNKRDRAGKFACDLFGVA